MQLPPQTHHEKVCLTQQMIDDYGFLLPHSHGQCSMENKHAEPGRITADYVCTGTMAGRGQLTSSWSDPEHVSGTLHFTGSMVVGSDSQPIEWTTESSAEFKDAQCGAIKPRMVPRSAR